MSAIDIPLSDRRMRMVQHMQLFQDVVGAGVLAPAAWARLHMSNTRFIALGVVELLAIGFALGSAGMELRGHQSEGRIDWTNLFVAIVLFTEYAFSLETGHKWFSPLFVTALTMMFLAFARPKMQTVMRRKRVLHVDDAGFELRHSRIRRTKVNWADVAHLQEAGPDVTLALMNGTTQTIPLARYDNRDELRAAIMDRAPQRLLTS